MHLVSNTESVFSPPTLIIKYDSLTTAAGLFESEKPTTPDLFTASYAEDSMAF